MSTGTALIPVSVDARVAAVEEAVASARAQANAIQVRDEAEANAAGALLKEIAGRRKESEAERTSLVKPLNDHVKLINQKFKDAAAPYDEADQIVRGKVTAYQDEQERIRQEEAARLEAERLERERLANEAREKQEAEARAKREQAEREQREAEKLAQEAKDAADAEAAEKLAKEAREKAQEAQTAESAIASLPEVSLPKAVVAPAPKIDGVTAPKRWVVKSIDPSKLPARYLIPDEKGINEAKRIAVKETGKPPEIPGVEFEQVTGSAVRA